MISPKGKKSLNTPFSRKVGISLSEAPRIGPCKAPTTTRIGRPWIRFREKRVGLNGKPGLTRLIPSENIVGTSWFSPPTTETTPWELERLNSRSERGFTVFRQTSRSTRPRPTGSSIRKWLRLAAGISASPTPRAVPSYPTSSTLGIPGATLVFGSRFPKSNPLRKETPRSGCGGEIQTR